MAKAALDIPFNMNGRNIRGSSRTGAPRRTGKVEDAPQPCLPLLQRTGTEASPSPRLPTWMRQIGKGIRAGIARIVPYGRQREEKRDAPRHLRGTSESHSALCVASERTFPHRLRVLPQVRGDRRCPDQGKSPECSSCPRCGAVLL